MAFPNIIGLYFLLPVVKRELNEYWADYKAGRLQKFGAAANRG
jgi:AGCS family alanine or glycine:cation symporter